MAGFRHFSRNFPESSEFGSAVLRRVAFVELTVMGLGGCSPVLSWPARCIYGEIGRLDVSNFF